MADIAVRIRLASGQTLKLRVATSISYEQLVAQVCPLSLTHSSPPPLNLHCCAKKTYTGGGGRRHHSRGRAAWDHRGSQ